MIMPPISGCTLSSVNCYQPITNTTVGMNGVFDYLRDSLINYAPTNFLGGSAIGILILVPLWFIIFIPLARDKPTVAWTAASFVCWLVTIPLIILQYVNVAAFGVFLAFTIGGALLTYNQDR
jgi:hypothetical protein